MKKFVTLLAVITTIICGGDSHSAPNSASRSGVPVATAKLDISAGGGPGSILSFGGKGTRSVSFDFSDSANFARVLFVGKYPRNLTPDQLIIQVTPCQAGYDLSAHWPVCMAFPQSATHEYVLVDVYTYYTTAAGGTPGPRVFLSVFIGGTP